MSPGFALVAAALLSGPSAAAPEFRTNGLEPMKRWIVYDDGPAGPLDLARLCRSAFLACGAVVRPGEALAVRAERVGGENAYDLLMLILAAHPGYRAEFSQGALNVLPEGGDRCVAALRAPAPPRAFARRPAAAAAAEELDAAGWGAHAADVRSAALPPGEIERYLDLDFDVRPGATLRQFLNAVAATDGRMMWTAESVPPCAGAKDCAPACGRLAVRSWRRPQALAAPAKRGWVPLDSPGVRLLSRAEVAPPPPVMLESNP